MTRFDQEIQAILDQLINEHRKLLNCLQQHAAAMKEMDLPAMESIRNQQEACRIRIRNLDSRRRSVVAQLMKQHRLTTEPTLSQIAQLNPLTAAGLIGKRDILRALAGEIALHSNVAGKLASAVLGHLNVAVKAIASAVQQAGVYTKYGVPKVASRIGALEAVG